MADKLNVERSVLTDAADGINGIIGEFSELGVGETGAVGRGLSLLALSGMEAGKASVQKAFSTFLDRWSWGVRSMVQSGNEMAKTLNLAAGRHHEMDETWRIDNRVVRVPFSKSPPVKQGQFVCFSPSSVSVFPEGI